MRIKEEQNHQTLDKENKEFFYAHEGKEKSETKELELYKTKQKKQAQKLHWGMMRLQNQQNKTARFEQCKSMKQGTKQTKRITCKRKKT